MTTEADSEALIARYGAETVIAALAPLLTDQRRARIDSVLDARLASVTIVLENLYDPHNGAAALRSVEGIGLDTVHVVEGTGPFAAASTVTIGCDKWLALHSHASAADAARALRAAGMVLCAAVPDAGTTIDDVQGTQPLALWFGNEHEGLTTEAIELCDLLEPRGPVHLHRRRHPGPRQARDGRPSATRVWAAPRSCWTFRWSGSRKRRCCRAKSARR